MMGLDVLTSAYKRFQIPLKACWNFSAILLHLLSQQEARKATCGKYWKTLWKHYTTPNIIKQANKTKLIYTLEIAKYIVALH